MPIGVLQYSDLLVRGFKVVDTHFMDCFTLLAKTCCGAHWIALLTKTDCFVKKLGDGFLLSILLN